MELSLEVSILVFLVMSLIIGFAGTRLTFTTDVIADQTGWGEALVGAILLGGATSLSGIITSVTAAYESHPQLAISNAIGGIAAQTAFLAVADITYRKANLEHASASFQNLMQSGLLIVLLAFLLLMMFGPEIAILSIHPGSLVIIVAYFMGMRLISNAAQIPMWRPRGTSETVYDIPEQKNTHINSSRVKQWLKFFVLALIVGSAGFGIAESSIVITTKTGLSETLVGSLMTAVVTSLPELITTIAAVRQRALTLAVGGIIGGNTFDILFASFSDFAYQGSIYHGLSDQEPFITILTLIMVGVLLLGLLTRQKQGIGGIGWESLLLLVIFVGGYLLMFSY